MTIELQLKAAAGHPPSITRLIQKLDRQADRDAIIELSTSEISGVSQVAISILTHWMAEIETLASLADFYHALPEHSYALAGLKSAILHRIFANFSADRLRNTREGATLLCHISNALKNSGDHNLAMLTAEAAVSAIQNSSSSPEPDTLGFAFGTLSNRLSEQNRTKDALEAAQKAATAVRPLARARIRADGLLCAQIHGQFADRLLDAGRLKEAKAAAHFSEQVLKRLPDDAPIRFQSANCQHSLAILYQYSGNLRLALKYGDVADQAMHKLAGENPDAYSSFVAGTSFTYANALQLAGMARTAFDVTERAVTRLQSRWKHQPDRYERDFVRCLLAYNEKAEHCGEISIAVKSMLLARRIIKGNPNWHRQALVEARIAQTYLGIGKIALAGRATRRLLRIASRLSPNEPGMAFDQVDAWRWHAEVLRQRPRSSDRTQSVRHARKALAIAQERLALTTDDTRTAHAMCRATLAACYESKGQLKQAILEAEAAVGMWSTVAAPWLRLPRRGVALTELARLHGLNQNPTAGIIHIKAALKDLSPSLTKEYEPMAGAFGNAAAVCARLRGQMQQEQLKIEAELVHQISRVPFLKSSRGWKVSWQRMLQQYRALTGRSFSSSPPVAENWV